MNNPKSKKILRTIYSMQGVSRPCLLKMSRYTPPTLYRIIDELMRDGYVVVSGTGEESGKGRPTDLLSLNGDLGQVAVLHISRTTFSCAVLDFSDRLLACRRHVIEPSLTPEQWVATVQADLATMCAQLGIAPTSLRGVGLAAVGPLDYKEGAMLGPLHFASPRWGRVSIKALAEQALGLPVLLDCNARAALMGHYRRDYYEKYRNLAYVTVGTGIGSGLILNRKLDSNSSVILDGLAHMIIDVDGRKCTCGEYGCLEAYVSTHAIVGQCVQAMRRGCFSSMGAYLDELHFSHVCQAAQEGDALAQEQLQQAATILAKGIVNYLRMVSLEAVILGGSLIEQLPAFFDTVCDLVSAKELGVALYKAQDEDASILHGIAGEVILQRYEQSRGFANVRILKTHALVQRTEQARVFS